MKFSFTLLVLFLSLLFQVNTVRADQSEIPPFLYVTTDDELFAKLRAISLGYDVKAIEANRPLFLKRLIDALPEGLQRVLLLSDGIKVSSIYQDQIFLRDWFATVSESRSLTVQWTETVSPGQVDYVRNSLDTDPRYVYMDNGSSKAWSFRSNSFDLIWMRRGACTCDGSFVTCAGLNSWNATHYLSETARVLNKINPNAMAFLEGFGRLGHVSLFDGIDTFETASRRMDPSVAGVRVVIRCHSKTSAECISNTAIQGFAGVLIMPPR